MNTTAVAGRRLECCHPSLVLRPALTELLGGNPPLAAIGSYGGINKVTAVMTCYAVFSIIAMFLGRETKGQEVPRQAAASASRR